jgi:hypothetical protein
MKQLFMIDTHVWDSVNRDAIYDTAIALQELNLLKPPYAEFDIKAVINSKALSMVFTGVPEKLEPPTSTLWFRYSVNLEDGSYKEKIRAGDEFYTIDEIVVYKHPKEAERAVAKEEIKRISEFLITALIVLLLTKNAEKTTEKIKKHGPKSRKRPREYDYITTIKIGKITETQRGDGDGQSSVRPHLRRGHIRNQRVGKGLSEVKPIFIQPCFINADESWINNQRKEYRIAA